MRSFLSITTVAALLASMASPIISAACTGTGKAATCHVEAMSAEHQMMHHAHHQEAAQNTPNAPSLSVNDDVNCPMDCCTPGHPQSGATVAAAVVIPTPAIASQKLHLAAVTFSSPGFSSHTDRGPPLA